jgi:hypothetical protein
MEREGKARAGLGRVGPVQATMISWMNCYFRHDHHDGIDHDDHYYSFRQRGIPDSFPPTSDLGWGGEGRGAEV